MALSSCGEVREEREGEGRVGDREIEKVTKALEQWRVSALAGGGHRAL